MTPITITLTAEFVCPVCKEVMTVENPRIEKKYYSAVFIIVTCPHCGEEYEGEA